MNAIKADTETTIVRSRTTGRCGDAHHYLLSAALVALALCPALPGANARDLVVTGIYVVYENETYDCMYVSGILIIDRATLTLTGCSGAYSTVDGIVVLTDKHSKLCFTTNHHSVSGSGIVVGTDDDAEVNVGSWITLTSSVTVCGHLKIAGRGSFANNGLVRASGNGTLKIEVAGTLDDGAVSVPSDDDRWQASASGATLEFASTIGTLNELEGDFVLSAGTIQIDHALATVGRLEISGGTLDVNATMYMGQDYIVGVQPARSMSATGGTFDVASSVTFTHL